MKKIFAALLLSLLFITPVAAANDSVLVYLAFVMYQEKGVSKTITVGGASMKECQEVFKAFLSGVDGATVQDFSVAACRSYVLSNPPKS